MGRISSIDRLSPELRDRLHELLARPDVTQQEITEALNAAGASVSKSAVNRYALRFRKWADRNRETQQVVKAYLAQSGQEGQEDLSEVLLHQLRDVAHALLVRMQEMHDTSQDEDDPSPEGAIELGKLLGQASRSVRDIEMAADRSAERRRKLRAEIAEKAADAAAEAAKEGGSTKELIDEIRRRAVGAAAE